MLLRRAPQVAAPLPGCVRFAGEISGKALRASEQLWVEVPEAVAGAAPPRMDAWLLWVLPLAFESGEDLTVEGTIDPQLLRNVHELMEVWSCWRKGKKPIRIQAGTETAESPRGIRKALCFTAGVDSFFSLLHHDYCAKEHPEWQVRPVDDLIYVWGYDIPLEDASAFKGKRAALQAVADRCGKTLVTFATNLRETSARRVNWGEVLHGPALGAAGLLLGNRWGNVLTSASLCYDDFDPWGSHPVTDPLLSTSVTRVEHYGAGYDRFEKTEFISKFEVALDHLHVCWAEASDRNCGECEKCFRTLLTLDIVGARERARTFAEAPFAVEKLRKVWKDHDLVIRLYLQMREHAVEKGRQDVLDIIDECVKSTSPKKQGRGWLGWLTSRSNH